MCCTVKTKFCAEYSKANLKMAQVVIRCRPLLVTICQRSSFSQAGDCKCPCSTLSDPLPAWKSSTMTNDRVQPERLRCTRIWRTRGRTQSLKQWLLRAKERSNHTAQSSACLLPAGYKRSKSTLAEIYHTAIPFFIRARTRVSARSSNWSPQSYFIISPVIFHPPGTSDFVGILFWHFFPQSIFLQVMKCIAEARIRRVDHISHFKCLRARRWWIFEAVHEGQRWWGQASTNHNKFTGTSCHNVGHLNE